MHKQELLELLEAESQREQERQVPLLTGAFADSCAELICGNDGCLGWLTGWLWTCCCDGAGLAGGGEAGDRGAAPLPPDGAA